jgi:hypothetical protein
MTPAKSAPVELVAEARLPRSKRTMRDRVAEVAICLAGLAVIAVVTSYQLRNGGPVIGSAGSFHVEARSS